MSEEIKKNHKGEITFLGHSPWPGYRAAFYVAFALGIGYLALAFSGMLSGGGH